MLSPLLLHAKIEELSPGTPRKHLENGWPLLAGTREADVNRIIAPSTGWSLAVLQSHEVVGGFGNDPHAMSRNRVAKWLLVCDRAMIGFV
jgi:hypothetical protein